MSFLTDLTFLTNNFYFTDNGNDNNSNVGDQSQMAIGFVLNGGTVNAASLGIPLTSIQRLTLGDLVADVDADTKTFQSKATSLLLTDIIDYATANSVLGVNASRSDSMSNSIITQSISFALTLVYNSVTNAVTPIPVPSIGANTGIGKVAMQDIFTDAKYLAAAAAADSNYVLIPVADIEAVYSAVNVATANLATGQDNRDILFAIMFALNQQDILRSATVKSSFTTLSVGNSTTPTLPTNATASTDPTTGLLLASLPYVFQFTKSLGYSFQETYNKDVGTVSARVVNTANVA